MISREITHGRKVRGARLVSLATINGEFARRLRAAPSLVLVTRRPGNIPPLRKIKYVLILVLCTRGLVYIYHGTFVQFIPAIAGGLDSFVSAPLCLTM